MAQARKPRITVATFEARHGVHPVKVRSNTSGIVWAVPARRAGMGHAPHFQLGDYKAHAWAHTLAELSAALDSQK